MPTPITIAYGDGIGPEITEAVLHILREAEAPITIETIEIGERIYNMDEKTGILPFAWDKLIRTRILLKAPTLLVEKEGFKDCSAVIRESFELADEHRTIHSESTQPAIAAHAYINEHFALFEPVHGPMPELAGKHKANPSSMLLAALALLEHIQAHEIARRIKSAWLATLQEGFTPAESYHWGKGMKKLSTQAFAEAVTDRLGKTAFRLMPASV